MQRHERIFMQMAEEAFGGSVPSQTPSPKVRQSQRDGECVKTPVTHVTPQPQAAGCHHLKFGSKSHLQWTPLIPGYFSLEQLSNFNWELGIGIGDDWGN